MPYFNRMADLTMRDLQRLHLAHKRLEAVFDAIRATSVQGKPALIHLINEADNELESIFRKGVIGMLNHVRRGKLPTGYDDPGFFEHVQAVMQTVANAGDGQAQGEPGSPDAASAEPTAASEHLANAQPVSAEPIREGD
jgi:hypothetical protein